MNPTRRSPVAPIQRAVFARLSGDVELKNAKARIYDHVPENAARPYVVIGEAVDTPDNCHNAYGSQTVITLHVWSDYRGFAQALLIEDRIVALLDHQPLTADGHTIDAVWHEQTTPLRDPDPRIRHIVLRFRVITQQRGD